MRSVLSPVRRTVTSTWRVTESPTARVMIRAMPKYRRDAWTKELTVVLPALISRLRRELLATPDDARDLREVLQWKIKRAERRMADLRERLLRADSPER